MLGSQVRLDHFGMRGHRAIVALGDDLAAREHGYVIGEIRHTLRLCSTMSTVRSTATRLIRAAMRSTSACAMPAVGSSRSIISGSSASVVVDLERALAPVGQLHGDRLLEFRQADCFEQLPRARIQIAQTPVDRQKSNERPRLR